MKERQLPELGWIVKIDIDSVDCVVADAILRASFKPRVIIIETMGCFPTPRVFSYLNSSTCMSHEQSCVRQFNENPWPKNCCLYSCSTQQAIKYVGRYIWVQACRHIRP